jgi:cytochrome c-type biogenesis protein CcsB
VLQNFVLMIALISSLSVYAETKAEKHSGWDFSAVRKLPIQIGGRIKPIDSFASDTVLFITESRKFAGWESVELLLSWMVSPEIWDKRNFIAINNKELKRQLVVDESKKYFSPSELLHNAAFIQYASSPNSQQKPPNGVKEPERDKELRKIIERVSLYKGIVSGSAWLVIPEPLPAPWEPLTKNNENNKLIQTAFADFIRAYLEQNEANFKKGADVAYGLVTERIVDFKETVEKKLIAEVFYNQLRPFQKAWIIYLLAGFLWITARSLKKAPEAKLTRVALISTILGLVFHTSGFLLRVFISGRAPVTNMYESVVWVSFGVLVFAIAIYLFYRQAILLSIATIVSAFALVAADAAPAIFDPAIQPLVPVLRSNYWLTIHVLTITLGYSAFALSFGIANVSLFLFINWNEESHRKINGLNLLTYRALQIGTVLLAAGTILGGVWADYSWGRFWGWDPKEVWALIALMGYLIVLHGRFAGYLNQFRFPIWTVASFLLVVMAWYGVNFVLGVGLHSYGFSSGGQGWVASFILAQLVFIGFVVNRKKGKNGSRI